jgi:CRP-like cAMP-binding protein
MAIKRKAPFDPKSFLAMVGEGRSIGKYNKDQVVFSQGNPADAVFYIQKGKVKVTVVSEQGKEAVVSAISLVLLTDRPVTIMATRSDHNSIFAGSYRLRSSLNSEIVKFGIKFSGNPSHCCATL